MTEPGGRCSPSDGDVLRVGLDAAALDLAIAGFVALWHGRACDPEQLLPDRHELAAQTARDLARLGRAELDGDGRLVGIHGLTLRRTLHRFEHDGRVHHTWCGFDSVGIPAALGLDATAATDCPTCGALLRVDVCRGRVDDGDVVVWLPTPVVTAHLMDEFCASADLYCTTEHLEDHIGSERVSGRPITLGAAAALGVDAWADVAGVDLTSPGTGLA